MQKKIRRCSLLPVLTAVSVWTGWHLLKDEPALLTEGDFLTPPRVYTTTGTETAGLHALSDHQLQPDDADYLNFPYVTTVVGGNPDRRIEVDGREVPATAFRSPDGKWLRLSEVTEVARFVVDQSESRRLTADGVNRQQMRDYPERAERRMRSGL